MTYGITGIHVPPSIIEMLHNNEELTKNRYVEALMDLSTDPLLKDAFLSLPVEKLQLIYLHLRGLLESTASDVGMDKAKIIAYFFNIPEEEWPIVANQIQYVMPHSAGHAEHIIWCTEIITSLPSGGHREKCVNLASHLFTYETKDAERAPILHALAQLSLQELEDIEKASREERILFRNKHKGNVVVVAPLQADDFFDITLERTLLKEVSKPDKQLLYSSLQEILKSVHQPYNREALVSTFLREIDKQQWSTVAKQACFIMRHIEEREENLMKCIECLIPYSPPSRKKLVYLANRLFKYDTPNTERAYILKALSSHPLTKNPAAKAENASEQECATFIAKHVPTGLRERSRVTYVYDRVLETGWKV